MHVKKAMLLLLMVFSLSANAREIPDAGLNILDIAFYRPVGLLATVIGSGLFIGLSPLTAFASISPPHDAFYRAAGILVIAPGKYTFDRPLGVFRPDPDGEYRR